MASVQHRGSLSLLPAAILYMLDCRIIQALPICFLLKDFFA
jgi:hypothetical protein